jgi:galactokinase
VAEPVVAFAPGRVNLIGEHTDYNLGLALPFAITAGVTVSATPLRARRVVAIAADLGEGDEFELDEPHPAAGWRAFVRGVAAELAAAGLPLAGARLEITGTVARGSGLASSAALEVAVCLALLAIGGAEPPERRELARICSRAENRWVGAQTGLLDQLASLSGEEGSAVRIDFRSLEIDRVPLELGEWRLVTLDSGERHANAASGYNRRRAECAEACERLGVVSLREATAEMAERLPSPLRERALHVVGENERVERTVTALERGDLEAVGRLLDESHASLRDLYEVSTAAVEAAVERLQRAGAIGARVVGGGFGGHVLGLVPAESKLPEGALAVRPGPRARLLRG